MSRGLERGIIDPIANARAKAVQDEIARRNHKDPLEARQEWLFSRLWEMRDPKTGKHLLTTDQAGKAVGHSSSWASKRIQRDELFRVEYPKVKEGEVAQNEKAFYFGLGDLVVAKAKIRGREYITVSIEAKNETGRQARRRDILKATFGKWGEIRQHANETKIYLDSSSFAFLKESMPSDFLDEKTTLAPFVFASLLYRLADGDNLIPYINKDILEKVATSFKKLFGYALGEIWHRNNMRKGGISMYYIHMKDPGPIQGDLVQEASVQSLPFFRDLARLGQTT